MHALNFHHVQATTPKIDTPRLVEQLAHAALKHIPGGTEAVNRHFSVAPMKQELKEPRPINLVMHHVPHR